VGAGGCHIKNPKAQFITLELLNWAIGLFFGGFVFYCGSAAGYLCGKHFYLFPFFPDHTGKYTFDSSTAVQPFFDFS
jgi:hypothetical protein